jgi:hypothetical protein
VERWFELYAKMILQERGKMGDVLAMIEISLAWKQ